ncbi:MAG: hypothetical protein R3E31_12650 [Chloroflexota bacterium]
MWFRQQQQGTRPLPSTGVGVVGRSVAVAEGGIAVGDAVTVEVE